MTFIGLKIWVIISVICVLALLTIYLVLMYMRRVAEKNKKMRDTDSLRKYYSRTEDLKLFEFVSVGALIFTVASLVLAFIPYNPKYYGLYEVNGTVVKTESVLAPDGSNYPVIAARLDTLDEMVVIDDPRAAMIQGESVKLTCERGWVPRAADKITCNLTEVRSD